MRKQAVVFLLAGMILASCQTKTKPVPVDTVAMKDSVALVLEKYKSVMRTGDINALQLADDGLYCGTDSRELFGKSELINVLKQTFADTSLTFKFTVDKQVIRINADGNSAVALEQMIVPVFSQKMPARVVYHLVKQSNGWVIDFFSWSFIPNNEDIGKINGALDQ